MASPTSRERSMEIPRRLLDQYFQTTAYPYTRHHLDSFNQFLEHDLPAILKSQNPLIVLKDLIPGTNTYEYKVEIYVGGLDGTALSLGTPTLQHHGGDEVRLLFPNEARLRNLTYASGLYADILVRVTFGRPIEGQPSVREVKMDHFPLAQIPIMLHSKPCLLYNKPNEFLQAVGECPYDQGGYFIIAGSEKILISHQEQAFNTLYILNQDADPKVATYASISCLSPETRQVRRVTFNISRKTEALEVGLPYVRKPVPICILFRALGIQSDQEIAEMIFPNLESEEAKLFEPFLISCFTNAYPILDTFSAIEYIKTLTKGFGEAHVLDILHNQMFVHVPDTKGARAAYLGDCVRQIYRVYVNLDKKTDRDDTRNQRVLVSGFLTQMLFQGVYKDWSKAVGRAIDEEYNYNKQVYKGDSFMNIFAETNSSQIFKPFMITEGLMRGFKGKWGTKSGEDKVGVLQPLSRLSYIDFMSHCRRVVLEFDTGMKLTGPRHLHTSQYGYFCTNETPGGASIGITKNLTVLATISTPTPYKKFIEWLETREFLIKVSDAVGKVRSLCIPVYINNGIVGYTLYANELTMMLKLMKWTGCLSASVGVVFFIRDRRILINFDEGRPLRPLLHMDPWTPSSFPKNKLAESGTTWRDAVMGFLPQAKGRSLSWVGFSDPLAENKKVSLKEYIEYLTPYSGMIEYIDPYEQNETYIVNYLEQAIDETTHVEIHPSSIMSAITSLIPFSHHNQSVRNQLGDSQSKQSISVYATNAQIRYDNQSSLLTNGAPPLVRTLYYDYLGQGRMPYGNNVILAMGMFQGYNQEDGIVINFDALQRGLFNTVHYRSYDVFEEDDDKAKTRTRISNPKNVPGWTDLKTGYDYSQLDDTGVVKVGSYVDENTILVGRTIEAPNGRLADASESAQVWTHGRVESVVVLVNNKGLRTVKIRCVEYRMPELGDKFSNRHGQKGTIGMVVRSYDLPRTKSGIVPDMMMNPHAIPSRMTIGQIMEMMLGKVVANLGAIGDGTAFTDDGRLTKQLNFALEQLGFEKYGNEIMYDGTTGKQLNTDIFIAPNFQMRLKHMTEDKWNARGKGRREQRTHQPTGGRGAQGGLRIGEMERDAIVGHGISAFTHESYMLRSDGVSFRVCKGCGTIPIENPKTGMFVCPLCTGPVSYIGSTSSDLELVPPTRKTQVTSVTIEMPYAFKVLAQELETYMNIGMRILTEKDVLQLSGVSADDLPVDAKAQGGLIVLPERILPDTKTPKFREPTDDDAVEPNPELLMKLGAAPQIEPRVSEGDDVVVSGSVANVIPANQLQPGQAPVQGTLIATSTGENLFQPNPTTVTVVPPARRINVVGGPEAVDADEDLSAETAANTRANSGLVESSAVPLANPSTLGQPLIQAGPAPFATQGQPQQVAMQPMNQIPSFAPQYQGMPAYAMGPNVYGQQFQPGYAQQPYQLQGLNVGSAPAVYAASVPPPAQVYTTNIPGAPPTISVETDPFVMQQYGAPQPQGPKPRRTLTLRRGRGEPGSAGLGAGAGAPEGQTGGANVTVTVIKGT